MVIVHERVCRRHPELTEKDVVAAWENQFRSTTRDTSDGIRYLAVGFDSNNRSIEMIAIERDVDTWLIFHAMTPPSSKTLSELRMTRKGTRGCT